VKKWVRTSGGGTETTVYIDGVFEHKYNGTNSQSIIKVGGVATVRAGYAFDGLSGTSYELSNHIGSVNIRLDSNGNIIDIEEYYPFGDSSVRTWSGKRYRYVGKEKDAESGLYYYGARYYSAWTCRFISVDPLARDYPQLTSYNYASNAPINSLDIDGMQNPDEPKGGGEEAPITYDLDFQVDVKPQCQLDNVSDFNSTESNISDEQVQQYQDENDSFVRLIFIANSKEHNDVFNRAAENVNIDYTVKADEIEIVNDGQELVGKINSQEANSVQSIDIVGHGGSDELYFKHGEWWGDNDFYKNSKAEKAEAGYWTNDSANTLDIDYGVFTNNAKIEMHGCQTASITNENKGDNLASNFSKELTKAGKTDAVVIAHTTEANPDAHETLDGDDYRHGHRRIYHDGEILFTTRAEGRIPASAINKYLSLKRETLSNGIKYDGSNQRWFR
jgi:RHS repeat-associated protein